MAFRWQRGDEEMKLLGKLLLFVLVSLSAFGFKLEGITFDKSLENGYKEFIVHNDGTKKSRYKVSVLPSGDIDVTGCLKVTPKILTIEPKSTQVLKIFGVGGMKLEAKEYPFILHFQQIVIPTLMKGEDGTISGSSALSLAPSVTMKGYGGTIDYSKALELTNVRFEENKDGDLVFKGRLTNKSHGATELGVNFYNRNRSTLVSEGLGGIDANSSRDLEIVVANFTSGDQIKYIEFYDETYETIKQVIRE